MELSRRNFITGGLGMAALALTACGGNSSDATPKTSARGNTYKIAMEVAFAPFDFVDADGSYKGIDVELFQAIAASQGFDYELKPMGFDAALQALQSGQADAVIAGMSITEERRKVFDFSDPYYNSTVCVAAADDSIKSLEDLKGKKVAVKMGTMSQAWADSIKSQYDFEPMNFPKSDTMYQDVMAGNTVACFEDTPVIRYAISTGNVDLHIVDEVEEDSVYATPYGFAVDKGENGELLSAINAGLAEIKENGTYDKIVNSYFKQD